MSTSDPAFHARPLIHLVKEKLHAGTDLAARVRKLRYKRRRPKAEPLPFDESEECNPPLTVEEVAAMFLDDDPMEPREPLVEESL